MSKILIDEAARDAAYQEYRLQRTEKIETDFHRKLEDAIREGRADTPGTARECLLESVREDFIDEKRLWDAAWDASLRQALADAALDKMADNARGLGLSYEQSAQQCEHRTLISDGDPVNDMCEKCREYVNRKPAQQDVVTEIISSLEPLLAAKNQSWAQAERMLLDLLAAPPAPAGYAKKIESLIAERDALKAKLTEQPAPAQEPVIQDWMKPDALCDKSCLYACTEGFTKFPTCVPPTAPTQEPDPDELTIAYMSGLYEGKKRKPLTDEQIEEIAARTLFPVNFARAIEAAHGIKGNT